MRGTWIMAALLASTAAVGQDLMVERFHYPGPGSVNSFIIDVGTGVVIVDAQRQISHGAALAARAEEGGRIVEAVLITHPHPDHVGGLQAVVDATEADVYGSSDTAVEIGADTRNLLEGAHEGLPQDTVPIPPTPDRMVAEGEAFTVGDVEFRVVEFGPSEAATTTMYHVPAQNALFTGDLVTPGMTPFLLEKRTEEWLEQLDMLAEQFPPDTMAYPGHGVPGPLGPMIEEQRGYITAFRAQVQEALADGSVSPEEAAAIVRRTEEAYPGYLPVAALPELMQRNIAAVAEELTGDTGAPPVATLE